MNVASIEGVRAAPGYAAYAAAKAGVLNFTKTAALEYAKGPKEYIVVPDITHFEMYSGKPFEISSEAAARWFTTHLK